MSEQFIGTVDVWQLRQRRWPIMRCFARQFVEEQELEAYMRQLLASGEWSFVRALPRVEAEDRGKRAHIFDVYGTPTAPAQYALT
jgi:hypothetical protein